MRNPVSGKGKIEGAQFVLSPFNFAIWSLKITKLWRQNGNLR